MSDNPHRCVIDRNGYYVEFVLLNKQPDGSVAPYAYTLKDGEILIEASVPSGLIKPKWNGTDWEEAATPEEIQAAEAAKAQETGAIGEGVTAPTLDERITAVEDALLVLALGGGTGV